MGSHSTLAIAMNRLVGNSITSKSDELQIKMAQGTKPEGKEELPDYNIFQIARLDDR